MDARRLDRIARTVGQSMTRRGVVGRMAAGLAIAGGMEKFSHVAAVEEVTCLPSTNPPDTSNIPTGTRAGDGKTSVSNNVANACSCLGYGTDSGRDRTRQNPTFSRPFNCSISLA
jgi:hypothetical protein